MGFLSEWIGQIHNELLIVGLAATPVLELRAAIPFGMAMAMDWKFVYILSVLGNLIPIPFIILFMRPVFAFLRKTKYFQGLIHWVENRTMKKAETMMKYSALGLFLLVAIPLPGTGAWTGAMVASMLDMRMKYAIPSIFLGVIAAGALVMTISYHVF
ncbi:small multi-drug export protein [Petroclostridium sp. X23]|uniref:COG2426 family protein n=1 Tax=Petroclostridium sp. X23 TaxID=3045146 RepID=UPI0024AD8BEB|nr:small multi-drug export protein [Petroclostridium sp. X23]WHH61528.1 small multi-drug export protein [Petroclostridium sp. X23]